MLYVWIAAAVLAAAGEIFTRKRICLWLVPAAGISAALVGFHVSPWIQAVAFAVIFAVGILLSVLFLPRPAGRPARLLTPDDVIGRKCTVTEKIDNDAGCGQVCIHGQYWAARGAVDDDIFEVGEKLTVIAVEGVKLICKTA